MSTKTEIVVCRASYREVFSAIFRPVSFSTATLVTTPIKLLGTPATGSLLKNRAGGSAGPVFLHSQSLCRGLGAGSPATHGIALRYS